MSSQGLSPVPQGADVTPSQLVCNMMESVQGLSKFKMPPEFVSGLVLVLTLSFVRLWCSLKPFH